MNAADPPLRQLPYGPDKLSPEQRDGHACIYCGTSFLIPGTVAQPGGLCGGFQVFRCAPECKPVRTVLLGAAYRIDTYGWIQEDFFPTNWHGKGAREVACCADAAICIEAGMGVVGIYDDERNPVASEAEELLAEHLVRTGAARDLGDVPFAQTIGIWNDQEGMTANEVAEILRDVAELAR